MKTIPYGSRALGVGLAAALFTGCAGAQVAGTTNLTTGYARIGAASGKSWMKPGTSGQNLLYVLVADNSVKVYTYPGGQLVGTLTGFGYPTGICSDNSGNVWVTDDGDGDLVEYAHGGTTPIATLEDQYDPQDCSVDPATGNLASGDLNNTIAIYSGAKGTPTYYSTVGLVEYVYFITYDGSGNAYFSSQRHHPAYLPKGSSKAMKFGWNPNPGRHGSFMWDGQYLAVLAHARTGLQVWRYQVTGGHSKRVGIVPLGGLCCGLQMWIEGSTLVVPSGANVYIFNYPTGGNPINTIYGVNGNGVTVSVAPSH